VRTRGLAVALGTIACLAPSCAERARPPEAPPALAAGAATAGSASAPGSDATPSGAGAITGWLRVEGNRILLPDGRRFHGRGANVHDTRSCDACAWEKPHVEEVTRRIDELVDVWHANFVRLLLESYPDAGKGRTHWKNVLDDEDYFRDVMRIVGHAGKKPGVYVLVSLWHDPTFTPQGWPTERTRAEWKKIAGALRDMPFVMFGLVNEPQGNEDGRLDAEVWTAMNDTVAAIRGVERPDRRHLVAVQGTREWGRVLDYYVDHPIAAGGGADVVYETHVYDGRERFDRLVTRPAKKLPVIIGELGVVDGDGAKMTEADCVSLMDLAERLEVPWLAYTFHTNCPPNLLVTHENTCGVGVRLEPSRWGRVVKERLSRRW
jgi:hypothetical protein